MTRHLSAAALFAAALLLSACSVGTSGSDEAAVDVSTDGVHVDAGDASVDVDSEGVDVDAGDTSVDVDSEGVDVDSDEEATDGGGDAGLSADRASYAGSVTRTLDCAGGSEKISASGQVVEVTGDCDAVTVTGTGVVVLAQHVGELTVSGQGDVVLVASVDTVTLDGTGNVVTWESGTADVDDSGIGNVHGSAS